MQELIDLNCHGVQDLRWLPSLAFGGLGGHGEEGKRERERGGEGELVLVLTHGGDSPWLPESRREEAAAHCTDLGGDA